MREREGETMVAALGVCVCSLIIEVLLRIIRK